MQHGEAEGGGTMKNSASSVWLSASPLVVASAIYQAVMSTSSLNLSCPEHHDCCVAEMAAILS